MKKIITLISVILALNILVSALPAGAEYQVSIDAEYSGNRNKISILIQLGIIKTDEGVLFDGEREVTRGEFSKMIAEITGEPADESSPLSMKTLDAVERVIDLLGYGAIAKKQGYLRLANELGFAFGSEMLTREGAAVLLYDALGTKVFEAVSFGGTVKYSNSSSDTLAEKYMGMKIIEGRVDANHFSAIQPYSKVGEEFVTIDGITYLCGKTDIGYELGRRVIAVVEAENTSAEIYAYCRKYNSEDTVINGADIIREKTGLGCVCYESPSGGIKKRRFSADAAVIYNGEVLDRYDDTVFRISRGNIILYSSKNGDTDTVYINEYETKIAESANINNSTVYFKFGEECLKIDEDICTPDVYIDGENGSLGDISEFDAVDIYSSKNGANIILRVTKTRVKGSFKGYDDENIIIDGKRYRTLENTGNLRDCIPGEKYTFVINSENAVCAAEILQDSEGEYGYLYSVRGDPEIPEDGVSLEIFTIDNDFSNFMLSDRIRIDGKKYKTDELYSKVNPIIKNKSAIRQIVMYEKNSEGKIENIFTACDNTNFENTNARLRLDMKETNQPVRMYRNTFGINYRFSGATKVFVLPVPGNEDDKDGYKCTTISEWGDDHTFSDYEVYNTKRSREIGFFVTHENFAAEGFGTAKQKSNIVLVEKNVQTLDEENCTSYMLTYYEAGTKKTAYFDNEEVYNKYPDAWDSYPRTITAANVKKGDILQLVRNAKGRITEFHMLFRLADDNRDYTEILPSGYSYSATGVPLSYLYTAYGEITDKYAGTVTVDVNNTTDPDNKAYNRNFKSESITSYMLYDGGAITKISYNDIMLGDKVFVRAYNYIPYNIIVIR